MCNAGSWGVEWYMGYGAKRSLRIGGTVCVGVWCGLGYNVGCMDGVWGWGTWGVLGYEVWRSIGYSTGWGVVGYS